MVKKIVCPTDFSSAAINSTEYAAKLAQVFGAELLFVNVQQIIPVAAEVSLGQGIGAEIRENSRMASDALKKISEETNKMFNISVDYEVDITSKSIEKILASHEGDNTMIVMGTNGADDLYQYFFGTNTYHVIKKSKCPVLVVPENVYYGSLNKIVFAWDYDPKNKFSFSLLKDFMKAFNSQIVFIHVSEQRTEISNDVFRVLRSEVESELGANNKVEFEQIFSDNIPESINSYMIKSKADLLAITYYNRGVMRNIFHGTVAKELSKQIEYPILVLHA